VSWNRVISALLGLTLGLLSAVLWKQTRQGAPARVVAEAATPLASSAPAEPSTAAASTGTTPSDAGAAEAPQVDRTTPAAEPSRVPPSGTGLEAPKSTGPAKPASSKARAEIFRRM
jgi:cytoskeletal protein RodZ